MVRGSAHSSTDVAQYEFSCICLTRTNSKDPLARIPYITKHRFFNVDHLGRALPFSGPLLGSTIENLLYNFYELLRIRHAGNRKFTKQAVTQRPAWDVLTLL